jgi:superfamily II DNA or RNA helicase
MSRITPLEFQKRHIAVLVERFRALKGSYDLLSASTDAHNLRRVRLEGACVLLQAPTGIGKTLMACELMSRFSPHEKLVWFWFAPFTGVLAPARLSLRRQAPSLSQLDIETDRQVEKLTPGCAFVLSWQTVAARSAESRVARVTGDSGLALDELVAQAREAGYRVAVVVDEAHHGFVRATEASRFFAEVLAPDYVLLMTATPRDADASRFSELTGYRIGGPTEWASVTRAEAVEAQLLKPSVKVARFIAQNQDDAQLVAFEEVAMSECAAMHRRIKAELATAGIGLTPLMLVQVPNGNQAMESARRYLTERLRFPASTVRVHTSDEPDPNLSALADDPAVEVLIFKMAVATGFDAPRAFTLAALRGTRSPDFGIQVVGRILRVHRLLQGRMLEVSPVLRNAYVFLANSEAQEGLTSAASQLNAMPEQLAAAAPSTVVTFVAGRPAIQVVERGESMTLSFEAVRGEADGHNSEEARQADASLPAQAPNNRIAPRPGVGAASTAHPAPATERQGSLFQVLAAGGPDEAFAHGYAERSLLVEAFQLESQSAVVSYPLKEGMPRTLWTEQMPAVPEDFEERLVSHIDFSRVLGDRLKVRTRVVERTTDLFEAPTPQDRDIWAHVSPAAIAERARQIAFEFDDVDRRVLLSELKKRFRQALLDEGNEVPDSEEELTRQLELVLVRNDRLIRTAHKRLRAEQVTSAAVSLPLALLSDSALTPAAKNVYGVFPADMGPQEREFAELLDTSSEVEWWHRNTVRKPDSVALYGWADGVGFFPDFVVKVARRAEGEGVALSEVKGPQLQQYDRAKAAARHLRYGRVFMVGKTAGSASFRLWRLANQDELVDDGPFEVPRLRHS